MTKSTSKTEKLQQKISAAIAAAKPAVLATYGQADDSTQAELRLTARWTITMAVDTITAPQRLADSEESRELWGRYTQLTWKISKSADLGLEKRTCTEPANTRTKTGAAKRDELTENFYLTAGREFIAALRQATTKRNLAVATKKITSLQAEQKKLLPQLRASNSAVVLSRRQAAADRRAADAAALQSGEFWDASPEAIKGYFHPPFAKNHLADISEKWRAALYMECESVSYKTGYGWRHKLSATGRCYLCGIDDNGDEWGHRITIGINHDDHGNGSFDATVEEAMAELFSVSATQLASSTRQGDLLFRPCKILKQKKIVCANCGRPESAHEPITIDMGHRLSCYGDEYGSVFAARVITPPEMENETEWTVRESHTIKSASLRHNGKYFAADDEITVEHTSHQPVMLPPGEYCLHMLQIADAD